MLTTAQRHLIDSLPVEGAPVFKSQTSDAVIEYPLDLCTKLSLIPLTDKTPDPSGNKTAVIFHGAPGSGKSYLGMQRYASEQRDLVPHSVFVSYDEDGALYDIPEYVEALLKISPELQNIHGPVSGDTLAARGQLWQDFQPLSQFIRAKTLKAALHQDLSLVIDTTSSSKGVLKLIDTLRDLDYQDIQVWSYQANLHTAIERIATRARPTSWDDILSKRAGAYEMLPALVRVADYVSLVRNDSNTSEPEMVVEYRAGSVHKVRAEQLALLPQLMHDDINYATTLAPQTLGNSEGFADRYQAAVAGLYAELKPLLPGQPAPGTSGLIPR